ncbi:hypothetical protein BCR33DRAFT_849898 [Rhizoclosmatium globosum]|uniref:C2H2-type domain-containing protein n=1 Tax=Rhizoclosmatium globosum TaxID=329046 RepID=A0A1Y2CFK4_9FUNG|nr:hypothetical protein BCR33DRAFT_849898 [Rhizoclosmatium globosum]|eukprot:ORY45677.1 hypothetical protein BCR33DRAFT_849898 [Rhizoclosmatium globosum]
MASFNQTVLTQPDFDLLQYLDMAFEATTAHLSSPSVSSPSTPNLSATKEPALPSPPLTSTASPSFSFSSSFVQGHAEGDNKPFNLFVPLIELRESFSDYGKVLLNSLPLFDPSVCNLLIGAGAGAGAASDMMLGHTDATAAAAATTTVPGVANDVNLDEFLSSLEEFGRSGESSSSGGDFGVLDDHNGLLFSPTVVPNVTDLDNANLDSLALFMMDQIMFPDEDSLLGSLNKNLGDQDYSNALKSDHLRRTTDNPSLTLEAFQSILQDPSVVTVVDEPLEMPSNFVPGASGSATPPSLAPMDQFNDDPFAFLDNLIQPRGNGPAPIPESTLEPQPVSGKRPTRAIRQASATQRPVIENYVPIVPRRSPVLRRSPAVHEPVDETAGLIDPNQILCQSIDPIRDEYVCPYQGCNYGCARRYNLKIHYMTHIPVVAAANSANVDTFSCFVCGKVMRRKFDMQRHRNACHKVPAWVPDDGAGYNGEIVTEEEHGGKKRKGDGSGSGAKNKKAKN